MTGLLARLKQRKLVQWALAYIAASFALIQVIDVVASKFDWPSTLERSIILALAVGFVVALVIAWYHGEKGRQRVSGPELLLIALVLAIGGGAVWYFARGGVRPAATPVAVARMARSYNAADCGSGPAQSACSFLGPRPAAEMQGRSPARPAPTEDIASPAASVPAKSIAVLPFQNLSGDETQAYFSDGITEEILNALAQIPDLKVAGRTSAFQFASKSEDVRKVGAILGVATVLEGSVQKAGDEVRITAQLIDTKTGYQLWSDKYDRNATNIFAVEDDISKAITDKLRVQLAGGAGQSLVAQGTGNPRAHELYLRGMTLLAARGPGLRDAADTFRQAVAIDPKYAQAWAGLAQAEVLVHNWKLDSDGSAMQAADGAVQRALELDPNVAAAHVALCILHDERWEWADAERECRRAVQLAPGDAEALDQYAQFLHDTGNLLAALPVIERANRLDPLSGLIGGVHVMVLSDLRRCGPAKTQADRTLAVAPDSQFARGWAMVRALDCRDYVDAEAQARRYAQFRGRSPDAYAALVQGVAESSHRAEALRVLGNLRAQGTEIARWRVLLGDREGALSALESSVSQVGESGAQRIWSATFDPIRNDPRFKALLRKMGLPYLPSALPGPSGVPGSTPVLH